MRDVYHKLTKDKYYRIKTSCPYHHGLYINTAHSSRGMLTSLLCAEYLVAEMLNLPSPLNYRLRKALNPNRIIIRDIVKNVFK